MKEEIKEGDKNRKVSLASISEKLESSKYRHTRKADYAMLHHKYYTNVPIWMRIT